MRRLLPFAAVAVLLLGLSAAPRSLVSRVSGTNDFVHFESAHVHPLAMTPSRHRLLVVNTPDNRLSVFDLTQQVPALIAEIPVGMEPVSVAALNDNEAWVVNTLSDDVSIVDLTTQNVRATLRVGDEPSDVVFAGAASPGPGPLAYVSVSQEDAVKVYHPVSLAQVATVLINGRMPRALARTPDLSRVYVAVFHAGNRTSVLSAAEVGTGAPPPDPPLAPGLPPPPQVGLIVQQQNGVWRDEAGITDWNFRAGYTLFDVDVAQINTATQAVADTFSDIGSTNFGLAVSASGKVAATALAARNLRRFEPNLRGHIVDTRAAVITTGGSVTPINLNPDINYATTPGPASDHAVAIGLPTGVSWAGDDATMFITAMANDRIARVSEAGVIQMRAPTVAGPTGVLADPSRGRVYVLGRFHNQLQTLNETNLKPLATSRIGMDPTPDPIVNGRKFFYGGFTSGHGEQACATCHISGDFDNLAWDLGDPQGNMQTINRTGQADPAIDAEVHPMKGPMATQSLRGLPNTGMLHWRADRGDQSAFNPAFVGLMGRAAQLPDSEMTAFIDFTSPLVYPPNPNQFLNRTFRDAPLHQPSAVRGRAFYMTQLVDGGALTCNGCHAATNFGSGTNGQIINNVALQESQDFKIPQLRNLYKKTGFTDLPGALNKRGFGFAHDGAVDNLFDFLQFPGFNFNQPNTQTANENRRDVEAFLLAFDTGMAPAVGQQVTFFGANNTTPSAVARMDTLRGQADAGMCELVAKGRVGGVPRGWQYIGFDLWQTDRTGEGVINSVALRSLGGPGSEVTVTGVPVGSAMRMGIDRDRDTYLDADERDAGSDPGNPASTPLNTGVVPGPGAEPGLRGAQPNPFGARTEIAFALARPGAVDCTVHDILGREVRTLARGQVFDAGPHALPWDGRREDGRNAPAGVYLVRMATAEGRWTRAVIKLQ